MVTGVGAAGDGGGGDERVIIIIIVNIKKLSCLCSLLLDRQRKEQKEQTFLGLFPL